ncbi:MAG: GNAT family N-acetyltransferase [Steroidobacteraceae bacterium]
MAARTEEWLLESGERVIARPVCPGDEGLTRAFVRGLSERSRYYRFHGAVADTHASLLERLTRVDQYRQVALIVVAIEHGQRVQIAEARFAPGETPGVAEFALVVDDRWQGRGIGSKLLERVEELARATGYVGLGGDVLRDNRPMVRLARRCGFDVSEYAGDPGLVRVDKALAGVALEAIIPARRRAAGDSVLTYGESRS